MTPHTSELYDTAPGGANCPSGPEREHDVDNGITGAAALLRSLTKAGVEHIFSSPGSEWAPLWEELARARATGTPAPAYTSVRHEELAVSMAAGYAKASGRLPAVVLHTTVGTLHAAMALRTATHERVPMVVIAGESIGFGELPGVDPGGQRLRSARVCATNRSRNVSWTAWWTSRRWMLTQS